MVYSVPAMFTFSYPEDLPVCARREDILAVLRANQVVIVAGETGSGKTTQLPKMCLEAQPEQRGQIGCTQPRRVAALSVSRRVAEELGVVWGREVGCKIRFQDDTARDTRIKFMTDGILLAEIPSDPLLRRYSTIILDEAHERSLNIDFLLGYLQQLLPRRPDLKVLITSATIDTEVFSEAFGGAPIVEVSGRMHPVEVRYRAADADDLIADAVNATEELLIETDEGDVLVFMPTERDIREMREVLAERMGAGFDIVGLFGRMPAAEQQRIFAPGRKRRVIVATNIAETSLTIPRIRAVVDTGLARISRYNPRTRTRRLPVEPVAQSSANQRAGRAGRLGPGVCVRLYAEDDFAERPRFGMPEIQRTNLAEVILRIKAFRLGEIETFPFLNPPGSQAIRAGYVLLHELGALDDNNALTPVGAELARLPVDPTLGRMLLQARTEKVLPEMLVIAAGLSVPDPRERPEEAREAAATAHRAFVAEGSDFLTLLAIWQAAASAEGSNALRRFCKKNYLSNTRMREWRDIHRQLAEAMAGRAALAPTHAPGPAIADGVHRSILTGLFGQIAQRQERNSYMTSGNRLLTVFPGSGLYSRKDRPQKPKRGDQPSAEGKNRQPLWVAIGEIVQTSQLFARTMAGINPEWAVELGAHLCERRYTEPHWNTKAGRVLVTERILLHGMEISRRKVDHGRINAAEATEIFIRGALLDEETPVGLRFFAANRALRHKIETALTRRRAPQTRDLDQAFYEFYAKRIEGISSLHDLSRAVKSREPDFLFAKEEDLVEAGEWEFDRDAFPDDVTIGNTVLSLEYAYTPGEDRDGVTVRVPLPAAGSLSDAQIAWLVPGLREEQIEHLLRALPKTLRRSLHPLEAKVREVVAHFQPGRGEFRRDLAEFLTRRFGVKVSASDWAERHLPDHLRPRVDVIDQKNQTIASGRDLHVVRAATDSVEVRSAAWDRAACQWEGLGKGGWDFGDLPEAIPVEEIAGVTAFAYPGLESKGDVVGVRLFRKIEERDKSSTAAVARLTEAALAKDLAWLDKELATFFRPAKTAASKDLGNALGAWNARTASGRAWGAAAQQSASSHIRAHCLPMVPLLPLTAERFRQHVETVHRELPALTRKVKDLFEKIRDLRKAILGAGKTYAGLEADLARLAPDDFLAKTPHSRLAHVLRYLRSVQIRAERAATSPAKDAEKARPLARFLSARPPEKNREEFRWMLEEFRVSIFAQELGTATPVSELRLEALLKMEKAAAEPRHDRQFH
ncbi:MAG: ATP-dependent RNA helicase HrpA [Verrucomicrobiae bacterium]